MKLYSTFPNIPVIILHKAVLIDPFEIFRHLDPLLLFPVPFCRGSVQVMAVANFFHFHGIFLPFPFFLAVSRIHSSMYTVVGNTFKNLSLALQPVECGFRNILIYLSTKKRELE